MFVYESVVVERTNVIYTVTLGVHACLYNKTTVKLVVVWRWIVCSALKGFTFSQLFNADTYTWSVWDIYSPFFSLLKCLSYLFFTLACIHEHIHRHCDLRWLCATISVWAILMNNLNQIRQADTHTWKEGAISSLLVCNLVKVYVSQYIPARIPDWVPVLQSNKFHAIFISLSLCCSPISLSAFCCHSIFPFLHLILPITELYYANIKWS